ncbi:HlyD family efflux transporter periplasmic adaptor subunit [Puniceicoccales bacterium CK1056]|uniref:HlyD family efflux transporter periplasmic adaptor subunit n=1 Tax=Oceanipulchritudo coccoides TaxID=2706888 RepID=A0A6B2M1K0_9BACT|nr:HlyD family efflux transporter periplasmic adaptor subunit [Oceanipulchritudo coccoides]NDV62881.1 HlyD family efflux transporter periplasmic adaptor subunit [Oceanipulchritudo coccoides]
MAGDFEKTDSFRDALEQLAYLRRFSGPPSEFWQAYLDALVTVGNARFGLVVRKRSSGDTDWRKVVASPANLGGEGLTKFFAGVEALCESALEDGEAKQEISSESGEGHTDMGLAIRLETGRSSEQWVAVFLLANTSATEADESIKRLLLANCMPADVQHYQTSNRAPGAASQAASVIDLVVMMDGKTRFLEMGMAFVNELAGQHHCERVSLGWEQRGYIRLKAISHSDKFEKKMQAVSELEKVMEEAHDQDEEIYWPPLDGETLITRDHEKFSESQGVKHLCSIPLRIDGEPVAVVTLERAGEPFLDEEIRLLRITADLAAPRLAELKRRDRWFGARWASGCREFLGKFLGPEKTWTKVLAIGGAIALAVLFFGGMNYRVEAPFLLRTENVSFLSAPFNGFIAEVDAEVGDVFETGQRLMSLDTRELLLDEAAAAADLSRFLREEEKARARNELAEMRIFSAQAEQARVQLETVRYNLSQAEIKSPFDAFVIEGELKKRLGAPVQKGDILFKVARLDRLYVESKVDERDIHEVKEGTMVEIAFASQPKQKFPAKVVLIEPVATTQNTENFFIVRAQLEEVPEDWWRPGMGGISKIEAGHRTFFWIIFHRTIDFLRMFFWI